MLLLTNFQFKLTCIGGSGGGGGGGAAPSGPKFLHCMQFSEKIGQIVGWRPSGNPESATDLQRFVVLVIDLTDTGLFDIATDNEFRRIGQLP